MIHMFSHMSIYLWEKMHSPLSKVVVRVIGNRVLHQFLKPNVFPNEKKISKKFAFRNRALMYEINTHNITGARS